MSPASSTIEEKSHQTSLYDIETARLPLLAENVPPKRQSLLSRALKAFWNSCACCALTGCFCLASSFVALKILSEDVSIFQISFLRSLISLPFLVPLGYYQTGVIVGPRDNFKWIQLRGLFAGLGFLFASLSTQLLTLSEACLLNYSYPALLALMLWVLRLDTIDWLGWIGILGTMISQALIAQPPFLFGGHDEAWDLQRFMGILCSFGSCIGICIGFIIVGKIDKKVPSIVIANHSIVQMILGTLPFLVLGIPKGIVWNFNSPRNFLLYIVASASALNQILMVRSFVIGPTIKAAMLCLTRVPMMAIAGAVILNEEITFWHGIGGVLLLACIALVIWSRNRRHEEATPLLVSDGALSDDQL